MTKGQNWTIIKESGNARFIIDADYYEVLLGIGYDFMSASSKWDRPNMLLLNGKIVVESGLADIAYAYMERMKELNSEVTRKLREEFKPDWLDGEG